MTTGPVALLLNVPLEITCCVRDPAGNEFEANDVRGFRGQIYCTYPAQFSRAPALTPGIYTVTWRERKPPESGKWRVVDVSRVEVPAEAPASTAPPTPNSAAITNKRAGQRYLPRSSANFSREPPPTTGSQIRSLPNEGDARSDAQTTAISMRHTGPYDDLPYACFESPLSAQSFCYAPRAA